MTGKQFMNRVTHGKIDLLQVLIDILSESDADYCIIDGLAVNAYAEPVVSLDLDLIVAVKDIEKVCQAAVERELKTERFEHSINLTSAKSDLRVQLQTDPRYQTFIPRAQIKQVLGYELKVAAVQDVLAGKIWAYSDKGRRKSKRQKDLADIVRLVEAYPELETLLPDGVKEAIR